MRVTDECDKGNRFFCAAWTSARYVSEIGVGFVVMALVALIIGVSTHSRRRRVWRAVAGLVILQSSFFLGIHRASVDGLLRSNIPTISILNRH